MKQITRHMAGKTLQLLVMVGSLPETKGDTGVFLNNGWNSYQWSIDDLIGCDMIEEVVHSENGKIGYRPTPKGKAIYMSLLGVLNAHICNWGPVPENWPDIEDKY